MPSKKKIGSVKRRLPKMCGICGSTDGFTYSKEDSVEGVLSFNCKSCGAPEMVEVEPKQTQAKIELAPGTFYELNPSSKYLLIMPKDAKVEKLTKAIAAFFKPCPVFVLAANDVNDIKIAELVDEGGGDNG